MNMKEDSMIVFIPQWSGVNSNMTDDMIGQIRAIMESNTDIKVIISDYFPDLRYFLHAQGILEVNYINIFDTIQGSSNQEQSVVDLEELDFPENVSYVYTPFNILIYEKDNIIAEISHGEGAHISSINRYDYNEKLVSIDVYDDRGFLSSRRNFISDKEVSREILDREGNWIFREEFASKKIQVNKENRKGLKKVNYPNISAVKEELIQKELYKLPDNSHIIMGVSEESSKFNFKIKYRQSLVLSFFEERFNLKQNKNFIMPQLIKRADYIFVDTDDKKKLLEGVHNDVHKITPYDTRFMLSISQEIHDEVILVDMRKLSEKHSIQTVSLMIDYLSKTLNGGASKREFRIYLRTDNNSLDNIIYKIMEEKYPDKVTGWQDFIVTPGKVENTVDQEEFYKEYEENDRFEKKIKNIFKIIQIEDEKEFFKIINRTRLTIDLADVADVFTQIASISAGIPQINMSVSDYCHGGKNGITLAKIDELPQAMSFYLDSLKNWGIARSYAVQEIKNFSGKALKEKILRLLIKGDKD